MRHSENKAMVPLFTIPASSFILSLYTSTQYLCNCLYVTYVFVTLLIKLVHNMYLVLILCLQKKCILRS